MSANVEPPIPPEVLKHIEELCEAMDKECILAGWVHDGRTALEHCRSGWLDMARRGDELPACWYREEDAAMLEARLRKYGTREWRKARPAWLDQLPAWLMTIPGY